jgi:hypothetical protein
MWQVTAGILITIFLISAQLTEQLPLFCAVHCSRYLPLLDGTHGSAIGIEAGYGLDDPEVGVRVLVGSRISTSLGPTHPPVQWVSGALSLGVKQQEREADHSPPPSAEVKKSWIYISTPPIRLNGTVLK